MKNFRRIITALLIVLLSALTVLQASAAENYIVLQGFAFDINADGKAVIHGYDDRSPDVVIPKKLMGADVTAIDDYAFFGDEAITALSFNSALSLKKISANAFYGCTGLKSIEVPAWIEQLSFGSFQNCTSLESLLINNGLAEIPVQCFYGCDELSDVTIPQSVKSIGDRAFMNCAKLHDVAIPDSVEYIAANAFDGCDSLVISCSKNSYARKFAAENKIPFAVTDGIAFVLGDANGDRVVNINDVTEIQHYLAELVHLDSVRLKAADSSQDGKTDISDATDLQMFLAEYELTNPIGEIIIE